MAEKLIYGLLEQSASIVPIADGKKSIKGWDKLRDHPADAETLTEWMGSGNYCGYGIVMNNGFHCIDIDQKNVPAEFTSSVFQEV